MRSGFLARSHAAGVWEPKRVVPAPQQPVSPEQEEDTPEDVAAADPVAGLIQMQVQGDTQVPQGTVGDEWAMPWE